MPSQEVKLRLGVIGASIAPGEILPWKVVGMQIDDDGVVCPVCQGVSEDDA